MHQPIDDESEGMEVKAIHIEPADHEGEGLHTTLKCWCSPVQIVLAPPDRLFVRIRYYFHRLHSETITREKL